jgi:hypothetical protein
MLLGDPLYHGQTRAIPLELIGTMQPLEYTKKFPSIRHLESNSVVLHRESGLAVDLYWTDPNGGVLARPGEFDGVGDEVADGNPGENRIALNCWELLHLPVDNPSVRRGREVVHYILHQRCQLYFSPEQVLSANPGKADKVVDQGGHMICRLMDTLGVVRTHGIETRA